MSAHNTNWEEVLRFLFTKLPEGVTIKEIAKAQNCETRIVPTIISWYRRKKGWDIVLKDGKYTAHNIPKRKHPKGNPVSGHIIPVVPTHGTKSAIILAAIKGAPEKGISLEGLIQTLGFSETTIHPAISELRSKGYRIDSENHILTYKGETREVGRSQTIDRFGKTRIIVGRKAPKNSSKKKIKKKDILKGLSQKMTEMDDKTSFPKSRYVPMAVDLDDLLNKKPTVILKELPEDNYEDTQKDSPAIFSKKPDYTIFYVHKENLHLLEKLPADIRLKAYSVLKKVDKINTVIKEMHAI